MNLGELEDGVSAEELLLEVLGDNNKEMETAEEVEATMAEDRVMLDRTDNNDNADNPRLNIRGVPATNSPSGGLVWDNPPSSCPCLQSGAHPSDNKLG